MLFDWTAPCGNVRELVAMLQNGLVALDNCRAAHKRYHWENRLRQRHVSFVYRMDASINGEDHCVGYCAFLEVLAAQGGSSTHLGSDCVKYSPRTHLSEK